MSDERQTATDRDGIRARIGTLDGRPPSVEPTDDGDTGDRRFGGGGE